MHLLWTFLARELRSRYLGTLSGAAWALMTPLLQLVIYGYVFGTIFAARLPAEEYGELSFIAFLAVGLWPWVAFSEALTRAVTAVPDNAGLLSKVALPRPLLVLAPILAALALHGAGFVAVLAVLCLGGWLTVQPSMWVLPLLWCVLGLFTLGLGWLIGALSVFVRDLAHMLTQLLMLLFFLTPILYPRSMIPVALQGLADLNPLALYVRLFRQASLGVEPIAWADFAVGVVLAVVVAALGYLAFRRLAPHFEDFL